MVKTSNEKLLGGLVYLIMSSNKPKILGSHMHSLLYGIDFKEKNLI